MGTVACCIGVGIVAEVLHCDLRTVAREGGEKQMLAAGDALTPPSVALS